MLAPEHRLKNPELFRRAMRRGSHAGNALLVVHALAGEDLTECLVGFVVPKKVYARAVDRNRTKRRLRHLMRERVSMFPKNSIVVVRALPGLRDASFDDLEDALDDAMKRVLKKMVRS
ncbi:MAG: ribonuclease P protein component [Actinomycetaceae bacterium]|nr:ribonuclease P protein component [Actinomycetaceae bacterium]